MEDREGAVRGAEGYTLEEDAAQNPLNPYANGLQNAPQLLNKQVDGQGGEERKTPLKSVEKTDGGDVLAAFAKDTGPAADAIRELLEDPTPEKAKALLDELPNLLPEDPALAAIIAEEMAKEFSSAASDPSDALANKPDANGMEHDEGNGRYESKDGGASTADNDEDGEKKKEAERKAKRTANHAAGKSAFDEVSKTYKDKVGAMERDAIGKIDFIWGDNSEVICHILKKHSPTAQQIPGVLAYGDIYESKTENKFYVIKKRFVVVLRKRTGVNHYLITGFKADSPDYAADIRKECVLVEHGE